MVDVVTIKAGDKYGPEYVLKLKAGVDRFMETPHRFVCLTDNPTGLDGVETMPLEHPELNGWWHKMTLFKPIKGLEEKIIWLDLDTVITGNIDFLAEYTGGFAMLRDFFSPTINYASGIMVINSERMQELWQIFNKKPEHWMEMGGDQQFIEYIIRNHRPEHWPLNLIQDLWPEQVVSYKVHCQVDLPIQARIVCFHGRPRPHEVKEKLWMKEYWNGSFNNE